MIIFLNTLDKHRTINNILPSRFLAIFLAINGHGHHVHTMLAQFKTSRYCNDTKILANVDTISAQFEHDKGIDGTITFQSLRQKGWKAGSKMCRFYVNGKPVRNNFMPFPNSADLLKAV